MQVLCITMFLLLFVFPSAVQDNSPQSQLQPQDASDTLLANPEMLQGCFEVLQHSVNRFLECIVYADNMVMALIVPPQTCRMCTQHWHTNQIQMLQERPENTY